MILFKSPADRKQIEIISQRIFPKEQNEFMSIYNKETDKQHGYILVDNTPSIQAETHKLLQMYLTASHRKYQFLVSVIENLVIWLIFSS